MCCAGNEKIGALFFIIHVSKYIKYDDADIFFLFHKDLHFPPPTTQPVVYFSVMRWRAQGVHGCEILEFLHVMLHYVRLLKYDVAVIFKFTRAYSFHKAQNQGCGATRLFVALAPASGKMVWLRLRMPHFFRLDHSRYTYSVSSPAGLFHSLNTSCWLMLGSEWTA